MTDLPISLSSKLAIEIAIEAARDAGGFVIEKFNSHKQVSYKGPYDLVTDIDVATERRIKDYLAKEFPEIGFEGEELGLEAGSQELRWIVDPIDGTRNYIEKIPHFAVSIGLANGPNVLAGVTYDPMRDEIFHAVSGVGAFLNGTQIFVSERISVEESIIGLDVGGMDNRALYAFKMIMDLWPGMQSVRIMGSAALGIAYAAAGKFDIYLHHAVAPWDMAVGLLLMKEAGGCIADRKGGDANLDTTGFVASNSILLEKFLENSRGQEWFKAV